MITLHDLDTAIAKCQGEESPNAQTCIKLAAYYTIRNEMYGEPEPQVERQVYSGGYSTSPPASIPKNIITYDSGTEFAGAVDGKNIDEILPIFDELMDVLQAVNKRLFDGVMRKIEQLE